MSAHRRREGVVLIGVILFLALGMTAVATFLRQATVDGMVARHRDLGARAEALARGGVELATAVILQDRLDESAEDFRAETRFDPWARLGGEVLRTQDGGELRLRVEDAGARLNLNALVADGQARSDLVEVYLATWLAKVIEEIPRPPEQKTYDPLELARNLIDWMDEDDVRFDGGREQELYETLRPPQHPADRPLLSVDELRRIRGFDAPLVEAMRPYVAVYPLMRGDGINPNTAPPWVLASLFHGTAGDYRLADEETVRHILDIREQGGILCGEGANHPECTPLREAVTGEVFPPPSFTSDVFRVTAEGRYGDVRRTVEAVIDRSEPTEPQVLAWRVR